MAASFRARSFFSGVETLLLMQIPPSQGYRFASGRVYQPARTLLQLSSICDMVMFPA